MNRRDVLRMTAGGIFAVPHAAAAQQRPKSRHVVGFLNQQSQAGWEPFTAAFRQGLQQGGFVVGQDVDIDYRWAEGRHEALPGLAAELVSAKVDVLVATGGPNAAQAAKGATSTLPTVFTVGGDPVALGLAQSLARPGGNMTGFTLFTRQLGPKRLELLRDLMPGVTTFAALYNPGNIDSTRANEDAKEAAKSLGKTVVFVGASRPEDFNAAFTSIKASGAGALFVESDALFFGNREQVTALAAQYNIPTIYESRAFVAAGGLMSYGVSFLDVYRQAGLYVARILKGAKPAELPVMQPTRLELVVNQPVARSLGIAFPLSTMTLADEVIE